MQFQKILVVLFYLKYHKNIMLFSNSLLNYYKYDTNITFYNKIIRFAVISFQNKYFEVFYNNNLNFYYQSKLNNIFNFKNILSLYSPYLKTLIIKGIGYRAMLIENLKYSFDFPYFRYLSVRVGHSFHLYLPVLFGIGLKVEKKNRKLVIYGSQNDVISNFMKTIFKLKPPSVYTGRGIRIKKFIHIKKLGKKDSKKGRFF